jgi:spermidine synthase
VEIDPRTAATAISDFHVLEFGAEVVVEDARRYLLEHDVLWIDVLMVDIFNDDKLPAEFMTVEFFDLCHVALRPGGLFLMNVYPYALAETIEARLHAVGFTKVWRRGLIEGNVLVFAEP